MKRTCVSAHDGSSVAPACGWARRGRGVPGKGAWLAVVVLAWAGAIRAQLLDLTFNPNPNNAVLAAAVQADERLWVGGAFTQIGGTGRPYLARLAASGALDVAGVAVPNGTVYAIALQADGKVLIGGIFSSISGAPRGRLARLNANGALDPTFAPELSTGTVRAIAVQPDGRIVIGGSFSTVGGLPRQNVARLYPDGTADPEFFADATGYPGGSTLVLALAVQADGDLLVAGQFSALQGQFRPSLGRIRRSGILDETFNAQGTGTPAAILALAAQRDGKILVSGSGFSIGTVRRDLARLLPDGTLDPTFSPVVLGTVSKVAEQPDGGVLIGGRFTSVENQPRMGLARFLPGGALDPNFGFTVWGEVAANQLPVLAIATTPAGRTILAGAFGVIGATVRNGLARLVPPAPAMSAQPVAVSAVSGTTATLSAVATGSAITYQWRRAGLPIAGATNSTLTLANVQVGDAGLYDVVASNSLGAVTSVSVALNVAILPTFVQPPAPVVAISGSPATFFVGVAGFPTPSYQWQKDGVDLPGATGASLMIAAVKSADAGAYRVVATNSAGSQTSAPASLLVLPPARLGNASVRTTLAAGQEVIVGFAVSGGASNVLLRAAGPALAGFGVAAAMMDPRIELYRESTKLLENDNWPSILASAFASVAAFPFTPNSRDAALQQMVGGAHSAVVGGAGPGVVLVEAYDLGGGGPARLTNLSARNFVGAGDDVLIAGFAVSGFGALRVLIRAVGPTLGGIPFGVPGVLADPVLEVRNGSGVLVAGNDNWEPALAAASLAAGAFGLAPGSKDAALQITLAAGETYTALVRGSDGGAGVALVEIYELP